MKDRRLDTAAVFERIFSIYRAQASVLLPTALIVYLLPAALSAMGGTTAAALSLAASFIAAIWYQGMVVEAVRDIQDQVRDLSIVGLFRSVSDVLAPLIWTALLVGLGVFCGLVFFIVPGLVFLTWWCVAAPAVVIERIGPLNAIRRSRDLVRGHGWQVFGVLVATLAIVIMVSVFFSAIASALAGSDVAYALAVLIGNAVTAPFFALAATVLYLSLRRLKGEPAPAAGPTPAAGERGPEAGWRGPEGG